MTVTTITLNNHHRFFKNFKPHLTSINYKLLFCVKGLRKRQLIAQDIDLLELHMLELNETINMQGKFSRN